MLGRREGEGGGLHGATPTAEWAGPGQEEGKEHVSNWWNVTHTVALWSKIPVGGVR